MTLPHIFRLLACAVILTAAALSAHAEPGVLPATTDALPATTGIAATTTADVAATTTDAIATTTADAAATAITAQASEKAATTDSEAAEAHTPLQLFALAGSAYEAGRSAEAVALFARLANEQPDAAAYYNLGNAYFRDGQYGRAIAAYQKAHALDHTQPDVIANLARAREAARVSVPPVGRWEHFARKLSPNTWALLLAVSFWAALALWLIPAQYRKPHGIWRPSLLALAVALLVLCALGLYPWRELARAGTVLDADTPVLLAPVATSPVQTYAQAGQPAQWVRSHGAFDRIRLPDGTEGWVAASQFATAWHVQPQGAAD